VRYLRGIGDGAFQPVGGLIAPDDQREIVVADVSRDAIQDFVVSGDRELRVWRGSAGGPGLSTSHAVPGDITALVTADFDRDGRADIATIYAATGDQAALRILGTNPEGDLVAIVDAVQGFTAPGRACAADVTGEGSTDIVVLTTNAATPVYLLAGRGDISFATPTLAATGVAVTDASIPVCADFDGDGRADLAILQSGSSAPLQILRSTGTGFLAPVTVGARGTDMAAADFDRDGDIDMIVVGETGGRLTFVRNRGDGRFAAPVRLTIDGGPLRVVAADLNDDGWPDLAIADADGSIAVALNRRR
jgi:hypothetical protein